MSDETLKYKPRIAMRNYGIVFALLLATIVFLKVGGNPLPLILLKMAVVPLGFLAWKGVDSLYRLPIIEHKVTLRAIEYSLLQALVIALVCFIMIWKPDMSAETLLVKFGFNFMIFGGVSIFFMRKKVAQLSNIRGAQKPE